MQHSTPPNPNPPPPGEPYSHNFYSSYYPPQYSQYDTQNPIPNPNPYSPIDPSRPHELTALETHSYASAVSLVHGYGAAQQAYAPPSHLRTIDAVSAAVPYEYYQNGTVANTLQNWPIGVTVPQHVPEQLVPPSNPHKTSRWKKAPKKTKIVQSVWCDLCKIDCNSKDMLDKHKSGKKHKANLEKLNLTVNPGPTAPPVPSNPIIGPPENSNKSKPQKTVQSMWCDLCKIDCNSQDMLDKHNSGKKHQKNLAKLTQTANPHPTGPPVSYDPVIGPPENPENSKSRKKEGEPLEDPETKRRKTTEGGAAGGAMMRCDICNVFCNSELVFQTHLVGRKHASMMRNRATVG